MMRNPIFRSIAVTIAAGALLAIAAPTPAADESASSDGAFTAELQPADVSSGFVNWSVSLTITNQPFAKEPALSGKQLFRGALNPAGGAADAIPFILDRGAGRLFLDLNANGDLTDDAAGVFTQRVANAYSIVFTNIRLRRVTSLGTFPALMDLTFYEYRRLSCTAAIRTLLQGRISFQGQEWQVGRPDGQYLLLRPWSDRDRPFELNNLCAAAVPFSEKLFINQQAYRVKWVKAARADQHGGALTFTPEPAKVGELQVSGKFVERLMLEGGPYTVVLDQPEGTVRVPRGSYSPPNVWLKSGTGEAQLSEQARHIAGRITINEKRPVVLNVGGPLTNSVTTSRRGRNLTLNYELLGAGGAYRLVGQDRSRPPEFTVYVGDKQAASGRFEFG